MKLDVLQHYYDIVNKLMLGLEGADFGFTGEKFYAVIFQYLYPLVALKAQTAHLAFRYLCDFSRSPL